MQADDDKQKKRDRQRDPNRQRARDSIRSAFVAHEVNQPEKEVDHDKNEQQNRGDFNHNRILPRRRDDGATRRRAVFLAPLTAFFALVVVATIALALWQFDRAEQKRAARAAFESAQAAPPVAAADALSPRRRAFAVGRFLPRFEVLIDNRVVDKRPGYFVATPFLLADGRALAALRGWVAAAPDRAPPVVAPPPAGTLRIEGTLVADDARAFELRPDRAADSVWQNLNIDRFAQRAGLDFLPFALVWDSPPRLRAIDTAPDFKIEQSVVYAWQWLSFAALAVVFYAVLARRALARRCPPPQPTARVE